MGDFPLVWGSTVRSKAHCLPVSCQGSHLFTLKATSSEPQMRRAALRHTCWGYSAGRDRRDQLICITPALRLAIN